MLSNVTGIKYVIGNNPHAIHVAKAKLKLYQTRRQRVMMFNFSQKKKGILQSNLQPLKKTVAHKTCSTFPKGWTNK